MIWVLILFLGLTAAYYEEDVETTTLHPDTLLKRYQMECIEETRVDLNTIARIKSKNWSMYYYQLQLVKDWALCVLMKSGVMTKEGVYKIDVALQRVPIEARHKVESQIDSCLTPRPLPAKDIAVLYIRCFQLKNSEYSSRVSAFE